MVQTLYHTVTNCIVDGCSTLYTSYTLHVRKLLAVVSAKYT
jgi:hypothetical protein